MARIKKTGSQHIAVASPEGEVMVPKFVRLPNSLIDRIDALVLRSRAERPGLRITWSGVVRELLESALRADSRS